MSRSVILAGLLASIATVAPAIAGPGTPGHGHAGSGFSAGEPGNPNKPARTVQVTMNDGDRMFFNHNHVTIRKGEQIRFVLINRGEIDHEFVLGTAAENDKHAKEMEKYPDMEHDDANAKRLAPNKKGEVLWRFTKSGEFEFSCLIPGHREAGMIGKIIVK